VLLRFWIDLAEPVANWSRSRCCFSRDLRTGKLTKLKSVYLRSSPRSPQN